MLVEAHQHRQDIMEVVVEVLVQQAIMEMPLQIKVMVVLVFKIL